MAKNSNPEKYSSLIKFKAAELGFQYCGISKATFLEQEAKDLTKWLEEGRHGQMAYMENHFDKRLDPRKLVPGAKSVVSLMYNYYPKQDINKESTYKLSKYAFGEDYHHVIKSKMKSLMAEIQKEVGEVSGRVFVDSAPVMDKAWAKRSGLGWLGKHTNIINKERGSFFFLAEMIIDLELVADGPVRDHCGTCTACLDACPTDALSKPYEIDASKCISYFTIELKEAIPEEVKGKFENWVFGCDICQDVCPWNRFSKSHSEPLFEPNEYLMSMNKGDWEELTEEVFKKAFQHSAVKRTKFKGLKRNLKFVKK